MSLSRIISASLSATYYAPGDRYSVRLWADNVTDNAGTDPIYQGQQGLDQAKQQLNQSGVNSAKANAELNSAQALAQCLTSAGTDTDAVAACQSQFGG